MAKRPQNGITKTRLCPPYTPGQAAALYECFLRDTVAVVRRAAVKHGAVTCGFAYTPRTDEIYFRELANDFFRLCQLGDSLAERLDTVLADRLRAGDSQVVAINSDSPTLPAEHLIQAFARLDDPETDVVLGPCADGGYYLIGVKAHHPNLVRTVRMSTSHVLQDTLERAEEEHLRVVLLPVWYDVDTVADVDRLTEHLAELPDYVAPHTRQFLRQATSAITGGRQP